MAVVNVGCFGQLRRLLLTSASANKHVLLALGSDRAGRNDVKISQVVVFPRVAAGLCVKPCETNAQ